MEIVVINDVEYKKIQVQLEVAYVCVGCVFDTAANDTLCEYAYNKIGCHDNKGQYFIFKEKE